jgi:predicted transglutaminase-like protease
MFYPTCYVYKIGTHDESMTTNETTSTNKKSETSTTKKSKANVPIVNTTLDSLSNTNKIENSLIKDFADNLLISAQRYNCIDPEKK